MFKSLIAALIPVAVLARGLNDGSSEENAFTLEMVDAQSKSVSTYIHTWNALGADGKTSQLQGDTEL